MSTEYVYTHLMGLDDLWGNTGDSTLLGIAYSGTRIVVADGPRTETVLAMLNAAVALYHAVRSLEKNPFPAHRGQVVGSTTDKPLPLVVKLEKLRRLKLESLLDSEVIADQRVRADEVPVYFHPMLDPYRSSLWETVYAACTPRDLEPQRHYEAEAGEIVLIDDIESLDGGDYDPEYFTDANHRLYIVRYAPETETTGPTDYTVHAQTLETDVGKYLEAGDMLLKDWSTQNGA